ncbi:hypothetical protein MYCTH_2302231 [Thermothelomyces thermophilus ATCC 42464]|uniref:Fucose-specific lectin n=1 Tax=Thermothelomyces thermophilus (strain ATCC 42464 / BCRC 31852 / DSM 1799) TaxID=573729 RepID=G2QBA3_THET4|nr:uncharacterized protein MYCTH_2302231 [Thermothelomyces thermophilus ATCC 42464]AEO56842.1 hypothetical protein MYCTH_2302231 [Thermothelomyces thermophilus ATCC 42464]
MAWKHSALYGPGELSIPASPQSSLAGYQFYCWARCQEAKRVRTRCKYSSRASRVRSFSSATTASLATSGEMRMLLFFDAGDKLGMMHRNSANDSTWVLDERPSRERHPTFPGQQIAATSFPIHYEDGTTPPGWAILAVQLEKYGSLTATYWDPRTQEWTFGSPVELVGGPEPPPAFTAIGINLDLRFYGIADGAILEYRVDKASFTSFYFTSTPVMP